MVIPRAPTRPRGGAGVWGWGAVWGQECLGTALSLLALRRHADDEMSSCGFRVRHAPSCTVLCGHRVVSKSKDSGAKSLDSNPDFVVCDLGYVTTSLCLSFLICNREMIIVGLPADSDAWVKQLDMIKYSEQQLTW